MKNFFLSDPFMDYLERYPHCVANVLWKVPEKIDQFVSDHTVPEDKFMSYLCERGNKFEDDRMKDIISKFGNSNVVTIRSNDEEKNPNKFDDWYQKTKCAILSGKPIIYQGYIVCKSRYQGGHGFPDLIVRSDYINRLVSHNHLSRDISHLAASELRGDYHYRIIDIKSSKLYLCSDGFRIRNSHLFPAYKGQITMYNQGLADIQGYLPMTAYILGNGYQYESRGELFYSGNPFERMGEIRLDGWDKKYVNDVDVAVDWYDKLNRGETWKLNPPSLPELYPNMSNKFPSPLNSLKRKYAQHIGELTMLWNVGVKHRKEAHNKGIKSWRDEKCDADSLGFEGKRAELLNKIIKFQQQDKLIDISPKRPDCLPYSHQKLELYVDFETIQTPLIEGIFIYMIGVYAKSDQIDQYRVFTATGTEESDQFSVIDQFYRYVLDLSHQHELSDFPQMYHWHHVERTTMSKVLDRLYESYPTEIMAMYQKFKWFDLLDALRSDHLVIKGCFSYGLKEVTKCLHQHQLIDIEWPEGNCESGEEAMLAGYLHLYEKENLEVIKEVENYNEIDCRAMYQVLEAVRNIIN